ncbi:MAG: response regulator transcription factor [Campylobacterota bacterium]|nr:response regulator transcription factor [Campylobacterota bacterium]
MQTPISDISILIAEDEAELREFFAEYLQLFFTTVYQASCGLQALELYHSKKPDIIITDINMPNIDGLSMIGQIRKKDKKTKIIITTAHSDKDKLLHAIELQLVKYLIKPVKSDELKALLFQVVEEIRSESSSINLKDGFAWEISSKQLLKDGNPIDLKQSERKLLEILCQSPNQTVSNETIYNHLFADKPEKEFSLNSITSLVKRIRTKLPPKIISNNYGVGYTIHTV